MPGWWSAIPLVGVVEGIVHNCNGNHEEAKKCYEAGTVGAVKNTLAGAGGFAVGGPAGAVLSVAAAQTESCFGKR